ncbi:MAG: xanthan lyase [Bacteroides sp.]|nr:hypothetical protein [Roseburia sp.]MCM1346620.1 xanthan lyase [Bacteroides sp.]MCM1421174.1 xanthan lyase [Bacteroides sp.]
MTRYIIILQLLMCSLFAGAQNIQGIVSDYFDQYERVDAKIARTKLKSCRVDDSRKEITIVAGGGFQEQHFTESEVDKVYSEIRALLPKKMRDYKIQVITDDRPIEELVPNFFRSGKKDEARLWTKTYSGAPWVKNISRPYTASSGLDGAHISLWQSHGLFFHSDKNEWRWQRPRLFCTTEDLFSQTFVIPYIIPMLENAGAVVFTPRERDWQSCEVIVDNDNPHKDGMYIEGAKKKSHKRIWYNAAEYGFANTKDVYLPCDSPFTYGTSRYIATTRDEKNEAFAEWIPDIPEEGKYAVYVSYRTLPNSVTDAHYTVYHKGGMTEFQVNQQIGGGTWVYLGTFEFDAGTHDYGMVVLTNRSGENGAVSADAVRFGGGMGNIARGNGMSDLRTSGLPRWAEAAKYSVQWYGMPYDIYGSSFDDDYRNDINCRSQTLNYLSGNSVYNPQRDGLGVPFELSVAFHTDAGFSRTDDYVGSLSIYRTDFNEGLTGAGLDRYVNRDLSSILLTNLSRDLKKYGWMVRQLWNRNYGEAREPMVPACILEMLSHQNFADMCRGYDPKFKFDFCRSVYKSIVKFVATEHKRNYVIQPLPVRNFSVGLNEKKRTAELRWKPTQDELEPTAEPTHYIVYTRTGYQGFDNGIIVKGTSCSVELLPDMVYSFKVAAVNKGGESFPSETLSACISSKNEGTILVVNAFTRLDGPEIIDTESEQGFDLDADPGVQYGPFAGFCGRQLSFNKENIGSETRSGLGYSGSELEGKIIMGNTFDYVFVHGKAIRREGRHSFASASEGAVLNGDVRLDNYKMVDMIYGVQKDFDSRTSQMLEDYCLKGGRVLVSGGNLLKRGGMVCPSLRVRYGGSLTNKLIDGVSGCGLSFSIFREMNPLSYSVPSPEVLEAGDNAFAMLLYGNGQTAGTAYDGADYKAVTLGFPLECITDGTVRDSLMGAIISFLCKK